MPLASRPRQIPVAPTLLALAVSGAAFAGTPGVPVQPAFHMAPAELAEPDDRDAGGTNVSALSAPRAFRIDAGLAGVATARLTPQALALHAARVRAAGSKPFDAGITAAVFSPAQIRAAYGLPALPAVGAALSAAASAALGAGQTIYLVDANHNPNALDDLNRFSAKFGLPSCASAAAAVPMPAAGAGCTFTLAFADQNGNARSGAPAYDASWAAEIALDVQWAHAIAPLARLVLVEVSSAMSTQLVGGVKLANRMGPGVVSMSFGAPEGSWMGGVDATFTAAGMSYVAAAGDDGAGVNWPAASAHVLAVGGTSLGWSGSGTRREVAWSSSGGGVSTVVGLPSWQAGMTMPGGGAIARRAVSDVAFNANPVTGQYVAVTPPGASTTNWNAYGGTSIATPQWAGLVAIANAQRAAASRERLTDVHPLLYKTIAAVPGNYAAAFMDIVDGADGACATCKAAAGYDQATGWGTPNAAGLLPLLAGGSAPAPVATPPVVPGGSFTTKAGVAFSQTLGITAPSGATTTFALAGAPAGLAVTDGGLLKWTSPVAGTYAFTATASTSAGASASGRYTLVVTANRAPTLAGATFNASTATAFGATIQGSDPDGDALTYAISGAPADLRLSPSGALSWAKPVKGSVAFKVTVKDPSGLSATASFTVVVSSPKVSVDDGRGAAAGAR